MPVSRRSVASISRSRQPKDVRVMLTTSVGTRPRHGLGEVVQAAYEPSQAHGVGPAHRHDRVGLVQDLQRRLVAVAGVPGARLEREPAVDDEQARTTARRRASTSSNAPVRTCGHMSARGSPVSRRRLGSIASRWSATSRGPSGVGGAARRHQAADIVEHRQRLALRAAIRVGVDQHGVDALRRSGRGKPQRDGAAARRAGRAPDRDQRRALLRAGAWRGTGASRATTSSDPSRTVRSMPRARHGSSSDSTAATRMPACSRR